ncbi:MAG TPA: energy transducer TonB [Pyrinomonadaceae bacterium]|jgi:TonB family protein
MIKIITRLYVLLIFASVCGSFAVAQEAATWTQVSPEGEAFTVMMPQTPSPSAKTYQTGQMKAAGKLYAFNDKDGTLYRVWSLDAEGAAGALQADDDAYLDACADLVWDSLLRSYRDRVEKSLARYTYMEYRRELQLGTSPGREYYISLGTVPGVVNFYTVKGHVYVVLITGPANNSATTEQFLKSFSLAKPASATIVADPLLFPTDTRPIPYGDPRSNAGGTANGTGAGTGAAPDAALAGGTTQDYTRTFSPREVTRKARILSRPEPVYPESARKYLVSGTVVLRAVFSANGEVTHIRAVKKLPHGLTERSIAAARQIKFEPAMKDGRAVSQHVLIEYNYSLY